MDKITRFRRGSVCGLLLASLLVAGQVHALEPEHEIRRLMIATEEAVSAENWGEAGEYLNRLQRLEGDKPSDYYYFRGRVMLESSHYNEAQSALERYIEGAGTEGDHYTDALRLITQVEKGRKREGARANNNQDESEPVAVIEPAGEEPLKELRQLYLAESDEEALVIHLNTLLDGAAWRADQRVVRLDRPADISYRIDQRNDVISIQESRREDDDRISRNTESLRVFGVNPQIEWNCDDSSSSCWIYDPRDGSRLMQLSRDRDRAAEIARTLGRLLRAMQGGGQS